MRRLNTMVESKLYKEAVDKFGSEHQLYVTVEEMAEAIVKITQYLNRGRDVEQGMIEEIADVVIMTNQCRVIFGDRLTQAIHKKLDKVQRHVHG